MAAWGDDGGSVDLVPRLFDVVERCLELRRRRRAEVTELIDTLEALRADADALQTVREEFVCPIAQELMADPVVAADGHTYEREAIEQWLRHQQAHDKPLTSPKTNEPLAHPHLTPCHQLRALINEAHPQG